MLCYAGSVYDWPPREMRVSTFCEMLEWWSMEIIIALVWMEITISQKLGQAFLAAKVHRILKR